MAGSGQSAPNTAAGARAAGSSSLSPDAALVEARTFRIAGCTLRLESTSRGLELQGGSLEAFQAFEAGEAAEPDILLRIVPESELRGELPSPPPDLGPKGRMHDGQGGRRLWSAVSYMEICPGRPTRAWAVQRTELPVLSVLAAEALSAHLDELEAGVLLHAGGVARTEGGVILAGRGGAGKSTAVRLRPEGTWSLGDECIVVRWSGSQWLACATPLGGDEGRRPACVPLRGLGILEEGRQVSVQALDLPDAVSGLAACALRPGRNVLAVLARLAEQVPVFRVTRSRGGGFWPLVAQEVGWP